MKKVIILFVLIVSISACKTQHNVDNLYDRYQGTENSASMKTPLFLAPLLLGGDEEFAENFRKKVKSVRILSLQDLSKTKYSSINNDVQSALNKDGFESWFNFNNDGRTINVSAQNRGKSVRNVVVALQGFDNLILINAKTKLTEKEMTRFITKFLSSKDDSSSKSKK